MTRRSIFSDVSASAVSHVLTNLLNFVYFFLIAAWMPKSELGLYSFCMATAQVLTTILTLGNSPVVLRRIAGRAAPITVVAGNALFLRAIIPIFFTAVAMPVILLGPWKLDHLWLLFLAFGILALGQATGMLRSILQAEQRFWWFAGIEQITLGVKAALGLGLVAMGYGAIGLFMAMLAATVVEGACSFAAAVRLLGVRILPRFNRQECLALIKEGLPLLGVVLFGQMLARFDWIMMGVVRTETETGEYSFAYRLFEASWLPHAILGTLLLPKLSSLFRNPEMTESRRGKLTCLHRLIIAVSVMLPMAMVLCWTPVVDWMTRGKYGAVNQSVIAILALSVPFAAGTGMLWNLAMAQRKTFGIMVITCLAGAGNIGLNAFLIPRFGGIGAAAATSVPMMLQYGGYVWLLRGSMNIRRSLTGLALSFVVALAASWVAWIAIPWWPLRVFAAVASFAALAYLLRVTDKKDWDTLVAASS